ncbi:hypothetical protein K458DRAFT_289838, partial [Lentithecium fluviatile CBS 122367]
IAVPSRLRFTPPPSKPLLSTRLTVKDISDVEGIQTCPDSRENLRLFPPATTTALAIQTLINAGCQIIGMSQMCSTVLKQETAQSVEFLAPFNPRADRWQSPSGGSSGQGCAVAGHESVDFAVASDCRVLPSGTVIAVLISFSSNIQWTYARASC